MHKGHSFFGQGAASITYGNNIQAANDKNLSCSAIQKKQDIN